MAGFIPRPRQAEVLAYRRGRMGVSAVPGSGKTQTLSYLAATLVAEGGLADDQEVLVVTLVNSAVDNFAYRVADFVQRRGLLPHFGYRVRTLHGLAHDIVRERPGLVGLADNFEIVDERLADEIRQEVVETWLRGHADDLDSYMARDLDERRQDWVRRDRWPLLVSDIALAFIRQAKDLGVSPDDICARLDEFADQFGASLFLAEMGCAIYHDYQRALAYRGAVDFDDLIRLALHALRLDAAYLERLRARWPYILEDEAQDSSAAQEDILRLLVGPDGNWVRVGDPNQAIYETFTTANPKFLLNFLAEPGVIRRELPNSGRSTPSIIDLANYLIHWTQTQHPVEAVRAALQPPYIEPTPPGDPQPNPPDDPAQVHLVAQKFTPDQEVQAVVESVLRWLPDHPDATVAVLVPRNDRGFAVVNALKARALDYVELLRSTASTRETAGALAHVIRYLADPTSAKKLATAYKVWQREDRDDPDNAPRLDAVVSALRKCGQVEDFLWPSVDADWLDGLDLAMEHPEVYNLLTTFRDVIRRWQQAIVLPIDQLMLTLAQDLFTDPADLAVAYNLALVMRRAADSHPHWRLPELADELAVVARNERRFRGFSEDDRGFDPEHHKGRVVVSTMHRAKGLEWDRVYLMSVNNYDFPSAMAHDTYIAERWFVRDSLNLEAEALAQLNLLHAGDASSYEEGAATYAARFEYVAERLRLLYVGITRAKKELIITWNTGKGEPPKQPAVPFIALQTFWEQRVHDQPAG